MVGLIAGILNGVIARHELDEDKPDSTQTVHKGKPEQRKTCYTPRARDAIETADAPLVNPRAGIPEYLLGEKYSIASAAPVSAGPIDSTPKFKGIGSTA